LSCMPENVSLVVAGRTAISDSRRNDSRYRLAIFVGERLLGSCRARRGPVRRQASADDLLR
jgi:hypothetical protein